MIYRIITLVLVVMLFGACQSKPAETTAEDSSKTYDSLAEDGSGEEEQMMSPDEEHIVSFQEFHKKYIATGEIKLLELPFRLPHEDGSLLTTLDSPEGAFQNIPNKNYEVIVQGLLPDTSRYYGIVYDYQMGDNIANREMGIYSTRVATFTKAGKFISRASITDVGTLEGASSCGYFDNNMSGYIAANLSFFGIHVFTQDCSNDGRIRPLQITRSSSGAINDDGKINSSSDEISDSGDEDEAAMTEKLKISDDRDISDAVTHLRMDVPLTPDDLTYFFSPEDLKASPPYTWYTLYYPTPGTPLVTVVRRIKTDKSVRRRHYSMALIPQGTIGAPYTFFWDDSRMIQSNEPLVYVISNHFILITTEDAAGVTGKSVAEENRLAVIQGNDIMGSATLSPGDLRIERNWIFAAKGMRFKSPDLKDYFSRFDWYKPTRDEIPAEQLTYEERQVLDIIKSLERQ
jgi:hypothetical protein